MRFIIVTSLFFLIGCFNKKNTDWQQFKSIRLDSLALSVNNLPNNLTFTLAELDEIQRNIMVDTALIADLNWQSLTDENKQYISQYQRLCTVGNNCIPKYKKAITALEEGLSLYNSFKKLVNSKEFNENVDFFKQEFAIVSLDLNNINKEINEAGNCSKMFNASYIRLSRKMDDILPE